MDNIDLYMAKSGPTIQPEWNKPVMLCPRNKGSPQVYILQGYWGKHGKNIRAENWEEYSTFGVFLREKSGIFFILLYFI